MSFSEKDRSEFRHFLHRQKPKKDRKDVQLYDELTRQELRESRISKMVGTEAYHSLRKRLMRQLSEFIVLKQMNDDLTDSSAVMGWVSLSRFLFEKGMHGMAWKYLVKAERTSLETERYDLLNTIYLLMMEYAHTGSVYTLDEIFFRQQECKNLALEDERLMQATALIRQRIEKVKQDSDLGDFSGFVEETLNRFELGQVILSRPLHLFRLIEIVRSTYLATRNLTNFESLILEQFNLFEKVSNEKQHHHYYRLQFLYMIAHVLYHNRKFDECLTFLSRMKTEMERFEHRYEREFFARYLSLWCTITSFSGKNEEAIQTLEAELQNKQHRFTIQDQLNLKLNLVFYYFISGEYRKANRIFVELGQHSDRYYENRMGKEWLIRSRMIQLITHYELGHEDISLSMIKQLEKDYANLFSLPQYTKAGSFLQFLKLYMTDPYSLTFDRFHELASKELFVVPAGTEESKAIAFYCWLKSKLQGREYYQVLLAEVTYKHQE